MSGSNIENEMKSPGPNIENDTGVPGPNIENEMKSQVPILKMKWGSRFNYWKWTEFPGPNIENEMRSQVPILKMKWGPRSQYWKWNVRSQDPILKLRSQTIIAWYCLNSIQTRTQRGIGDIGSWTIRYQSDTKKKYRQYR